jgi:hypothetical protein
MSEDEIHGLFIQAWNWVLSDKDRYIAECERKVNHFSDTASLDGQETALKKECEDYDAKMRECILHNARHAGDQEKYQTPYDELMALRNASLEKLKAVIAKKQEHTVMREKTSHFLSTLKPINTPLTDFDEQLWRSTVEAVTVYTPEHITVRFISDIEVFVHMNR